MSQNIYECDMWPRPPPNVQFFQDYKLIIHGFPKQKYITLVAGCSQGISPHFPLPTSQLSSACNWVGGHIGSNSVSQPLYFSSSLKLLHRLWLQMMSAMQDSSRKTSGHVSSMFIYRMSSGQTHTWRHVIPSLRTHDSIRSRQGLQYR